MELKLLLIVGPVCIVTLIVTLLLRPSVESQLADAVIQAGWTIEQDQTTHLENQEALSGVELEHVWLITQQGAHIVGRVTWGVVRNEAVLKTELSKGSVISLGHTQGFLVELPGLIPHSVFASVRGQQYLTVEYGRQADGNFSAWDGQTIPSEVRQLVELLSLK